MKERGREQGRRRETATATPSCCSSFFILFGNVIKIESFTHSGDPHLVSDDDDDASSSCSSGLFGVCPAACSVPPPPPPVLIQQHLPESAVDVHLQQQQNTSNTSRSNWLPVQLVFVVLHSVLFFTLCCCSLCVVVLLVT